MTVNAGEGDDTILVGGNNHLDRIFGPLTIDGGGGSDRLVLNDQASLYFLPPFYFGGGYYTITDREVTLDYRRFVGDEELSFHVAVGYTGIENLVVNTTNYSDTIDIRSTALGVTTTVNAGDGDDTINVGSASNRLDTVFGAVTVNGQDGDDVLNFNDQGGE